MGRFIIGPSPLHAIRKLPVKTTENNRNYAIERFDNHHDVARYPDHEKSSRHKENVYEKSVDKSNKQYQAQLSQPHIPLTDSKRQKTLKLPVFMKGNIYYIKLSVIRSIKTLSSATPYNNKDAKLLLLKLIKSNVAGKIMNRI